MQKGVPAEHIELVVAGLGLGTALCSTGLWTFPAVTSTQAVSPLAAQLFLVAGLAIVAGLCACRKSSVLSSRYLIISVCGLLFLDLFANEILGIESQLLGNGLRYLSYGLGQVLLASWVFLLYRRFPSFAIDACIAALFSVAVIQVLFSLVVPQALPYLNAVLPIASAIAYAAIHGSQGGPSAGGSGDDACADADIRPKPRITTKLVGFAVSLVCYNLVLTGLHQVWPSVNPTPEGLMTIQFLAAAGTAVAGFMLLWFRWQSKKPQGLVFMRAFILVFAYLALYLSLFATESASSLVYLLPYHAAHKILYVLVFAYCGFSERNDARRLATFCVLMICYRIPVIIEKLTSADFSNLIIVGAAAVFLLLEFFGSMYRLVFNEEEVTSKALSTVQDIEAEAEMIEAPAAQRRSLEDVLVSEYKLTPREIEILVLIVKNESMRSIAEKLYISQSTVKTHLQNLYSKFDVHSRYELLEALSEIKNRR